VKHCTLSKLLAALLCLPWAITRADGADQTPGYWLDGGRVRPLARLPSQHAYLAGAMSPATAKGLRHRVGETGLQVLEENDFLLRIEGSAGTTREEIAVALADTPAFGRELLPVYQGGSPQHPQIFIASGELIVGLQTPSIEAAATLARDTPGLRLLRPLAGSDAYLYACADPEECLPLSLQIAEHPGVTFAYPNWVRPRQPRQVSSENAEMQANDPLLPEQWHLNGYDAASQGTGVHALASWQTATGGPQQVVGVVDSGCELDHPDLAANVASALSWDYVDQDALPDGPPHGTAVAGLAAARGGNGIGVSGVAPLGALAAIRLDPAFTDSNESQALLHQIQAIAIYNNSWGPPDDGNLEGPGPATAAALATGAREGRGGRGGIYVWAAGNGRAMGDNANYDGYANAPQVITVSATNRHGRQAYYSEPGANLWLNAPGGDDYGWLTTTDLRGWRGYDAADYTGQFGGTSAAAALVSGTAALVLHARPELSWRELRWLLAATAERNDPADDDWMANQAGLWVSHKYGFGRVDAAAAVAAAPTQPTLPPQQRLEYLLDMPAPIPDGAPGGMELALEVPADLVVEYVQATVDSDHPHWGELAISLTSPAGTPSRLAEPHASEGAQLLGGWSFGSARHLGETARGVWRLRVVDQSPGNHGAVRRWRLTLYGHQASSGLPEPLPPTERPPVPVPTLGHPTQLLLAALLALLALLALRGCEKTAGLLRTPRNTRGGVALREKGSHLAG
jgi:subtilisin-like proprotein convertase family protein